MTNSAGTRTRIEENESRLHTAHLTLPTSKEDTFDKGNLKQTAVNDGTRKLAFKDQQSYIKIALGDMQNNDKPVQKILGVQWNFVKDQFKFDFSTIAKQTLESIPTKRNITTTTAKFYDPIGFLSLVIMQFKLLFQELCESKIYWDDMLEEELRKPLGCLIDLDHFSNLRCLLQVAAYVLRFL